MHRAPRLAGLNAERDRIIDEVTSRVVSARVRKSRAGGDASLEYALNEAAYHEILRLEKDPSAAAKRRALAWHKLSNRLARMTEATARESLTDLVRELACDVAGNFNHRVYRVANDVLPPALSLLFSPLGSLRGGLSALEGMRSRIVTVGPLAAIRAAAERGTLIVTPTHSSNLDSVVLGFGLSRSGLPPVTYGAGKNLFSNPFLGFFMHNLGAYRVDRRLKFGLYKDVLKEYSTVLLERGYHSLFFPGGTRCRSNQVERHLKLGLLGTGLAALENGLRSGQAVRPIYVVPVTINYRLVLEAETLIDDHLAEIGKSRYIIEDDEASRLGRIVEFSRKIIAHEGAVVLRLGQPMDVFGNLTDDDGASIDHRGRPVDPATYLRGADGTIARDPQRDTEYTRILGRALGAAYLRQTVLMSPHLLARAMFEAICDQAGTRDIYRLLRMPESGTHVPFASVLSGIDGVRRAVAENPAWGELSDSVRGAAAEDVADDAIRALSTYHTREIVRRRGRDLTCPDLKLLFYYQNRTDHIPAEALA